LEPGGDALAYATYLGGEGDDRAFGVAVDGDGAAYVAGYTDSTDFPTEGPLQGNYGGGEDDAFVAKLEPGGDALAYATYLGGEGFDQARAVAVDGQGAAYAAGSTDSTDFPTEGALQGSNAGYRDAFVAKLEPDGDALAYATYLGGENYDFAWAVAADGDGAAYVAGSTASIDFPTEGALQGSKFGGDDAFVAKIDDPPPLEIEPSGASVPPKGTVTFEASGGSEAGYVWTLSTNASGGSIDSSTGEYTAGETGEVTDIVMVTDSLDNTATAEVQVGVTITPPDASVPPQGTVTFEASGDSEAGYVWTLSTNASGGSIEEDTGEYIAGETGEVTDVVAVTDSLGNTASAEVAVGPGVAIEPVAPEAPPMGTIAFEASGGSGEGYTWSLESDGSHGATIDEEGLYAAGASEEATDRVRATDSLGNFAEVEVSVGAGIAINPPAPETPPRGAVTFTATGGSGEGHVWAVVDNESGASVDAESGEYTAGPDGASTDTVEVTDSVGNVASVTIEVGPGVSVDPAEAEVEAGGELSLSASGGSGTGYQWSLVTDGSGGAAVSEAGGYTAGPEAGTDVVRVIDSLGNEAEATVTVTAVEAPAADGGCGCRVSSGSDGAGYLLLVGTFGLLVFRRRRRGQVQEGTAGRL
ncbi:MAG: SBBP repeat-containing protein, partial [Myxococcota bacterium]